MNIKRDTAFFCLFFYSIISSAQYVDIGIRVNNMSRHDGKFYNDKLYITDDKIDTYGTDIQTFSGDLVVENIRKENTFYRVRIRYQKTSGTVFNRYNLYNGETRTFNQKTDALGYGFAIGIGKFYEVKKITFKIGIELPVNIFSRSNQSNYYILEDFDTSGNQYASTKINFDKPTFYYIKLNMLTNVYYNFWKSFSIGFEVTNGFVYSIENGLITIEYEYYDGNGNLIGTDTENDKKDTKAFSTFFLTPSMGLIYRF